MLPVLSPSVGKLAFAMSWRTNLKMIERQGASGRSASGNVCAFSQVAVGKQGSGGGWPQGYF